MGETYKNQVFIAKGIILFLICLLIITGCGQNNIVGDSSEKGTTNRNSNEEQVISEPKEESSKPEIKPYTTEANLIAVGDIMMHSTETKAGYISTTKSYNFDSFFINVKEILSKGDWVLGNLETPTAGEDLRYTGYPTFNAPTEIIDACKAAGFNILTNANNHALDRGEKGIIRTRDALETRNIYTQGTARNAEEAKEILVVEKNGIKMAILAYTYGTNGIPTPKGKEYLVALIDQSRIIEDIGRAKELGVDIITVSLHFGLEYQRQPNQQQIDLAHSLIAAGADIILGSHPHVVQPYQQIEVKREDGTTRKGVIIYSLGNFISGQKGEDRNLGLIFGVKIIKHFPNGEVELGEITSIPTWVQKYQANGKDTFRVLPIEQTIQEKTDQLLKANDYQTLEGYLKKMKAHVSSMDTAVLQQSDPKSD